METPHIYLEHVNITVSNLKEAIHFFTTAFPDFAVRAQGKQVDREWIHLGNAQSYVALFSPYERAESEIHPINYTKNGFNHVGFVVQDIEGIAERLLAAGYVRDYPKQVESVRIRDYFIDHDGNEFEFVQYLTEDPALRNHIE